jgi:hypothetical protein
MYGERYPLAMMAVFFVLRRPEPNQIEASKLPRAYDVLFPRLFILLNAAWEELAPLPPLANAV